MSILRRYMQSVRGDVILHFQHTQMIPEKDKTNMEKFNNWWTHEKYRGVNCTVPSTVLETWKFQNKK